MKLSWLEVIVAVARMGNRKMVARALNIKPSLVHGIIWRAEERLDTTLFHRIPWLNKKNEQLWEVADDSAQIIINHSKAILHNMMMAEETAFTITRKNPDEDARYLLRTEDIERVVVLNGNSLKVTSLILDMGGTQIDNSLKKVERWLGISLYYVRQITHEKLKVLTQEGKQILPYLLAIHSHYEEILELTRGEDGRTE